MAPETGAMEYTSVVPPQLLEGPLKIPGREGVAEIAKQREPVAEVPPHASDAVTHSVPFV